MPSPKENSCRLVHLSRGGQAWLWGMKGWPATTAPGPVTLTKRSHRRRSPLGTGSGNARAPPRSSCSAPAGRTWAFPETSSSGGRGARGWPSGGPACTRTRSLALGARRVGLGSRTGRTRRCGCCDPAASRARCPCQLQRLDAPGRPGQALLGVGARPGARGCARLAPPAPSPDQADSGLRHGTRAPAAAPAEVPVVAFPEPANWSLPPHSRENRSRDSTRTEILPNMEPAHGRGLMRGEDARTSSREKRATAGDQRQELAGYVLVKGAKADPGRRG